MKNPYELAHRMRTVENADQIIVLDGGVVAERGTHAELMSIRISQTSMEAIAAICKVPMIRNGNNRINIGNIVKMTAQIGNAAVPVTIATISVMTNRR